MVDSEKNFRTYIELHHSVRAPLDVAVEQSGQSMVMFLSRVVAWFVVQDEQFRRDVAAGGMDAVDNLLARRQAALMADPKSDPLSKLTFEQAASVARQAIARMQAIREGEGKALSEALERESKSKKKG